MSNAEVVVTHPKLPWEVTMTVGRNFLARTHVVPAARTAFVCQFKDAYKATHNRDAGWIEFKDLVITETAESKAQPQGCGCECAGCDQGYHCHKESRECYM